MVTKRFTQICLNFLLLTKTTRSVSKYIILHMYSFKEEKCMFISKAIKKIRIKRKRYWMELDDDI